MRKLLVNNSISGVAQTLINVVLLLIVIPVFISQLGIELYGVFALMMVIGNLNVFANLGLTNALIKFLAEQGKTKESHHDIVISLMLIIVIISPITVAGLYFNEFIILSVFNVPDIYFFDAKLLYSYLLLSNFFLVLGQIPRAVLDSGQHLVTTNILQMLYGFFYWGLILLVVEFGYTLPEVGMASLAAALLWFLVISYKASTYWGEIQLDGLYVNFKPIVIKQLLYGSKIYAGGVFNFLFEPLSKILISNYVGIAEVAYLDIAMRIKSQIHSVFLKLFYPLYPFISSLNNTKKVRLLVQDLEQKIFILIIPFVCMAVYVTYPLLNLWIDVDVDIISNCTVVILSSFLLCSVTIIPNYAFLISKGHADKTMILQGSLVVVNTIVFFALLDQLGFYAIVIANSSAIVFSFFLSIHFQKKHLGCPIFTNWIQVWKLIIMATVNMVLGYFIDKSIDGDWEKIISITLLLSCATLILIRGLKLINSEDILRYTGRNERLKNIGLKVFVKTAPDLSEIGKEIK